jgi:hypothetical protein
MGLQCTRVSYSELLVALTVSKPFHQWVFPDGTLWASFFRTDTGYRVSFPDLADFDVSASGLDVQAHPAPGVDDSTVEHLYLNQVHPLALSRQGRLVLHGGAVEVPTGAIAFLGLSGRGKSTLTASFASEGQRFMTDDCLLLEKTPMGYEVCPSHPSIRLWDDSREALVHEDAALAAPVQYTPKSRVLSDDVLAFCNHNQPLRGVYFLGEEDVNDVVISALSPSEALIELAKNSFLLDTQMQDAIAQHFDELSQMVARSMFFRLDYPRRYEELPRVRAAILAHAAKASV